MAEVAIAADRIGAVLEHLEAEREERVFAAVLEAAHAGVPVLVEAAPRTPGGGPHLNQTIRAEAIPRGAELLVDAPYAAFVERGTRPHWAPIQPLVDWVMKRAAEFGLEPGEDLEAAAKRIAYAIRGAIAQRGTKPTWFVKNSLPRLRTVLGDVLRRRLG